MGVDSPASEELRLELVRLEVAENLWNAISELIAKLKKRFRFFIKKAYKKERVEERRGIEATPQRVKESLFLKVRCEID